MNLKDLNPWWKTGEIEKEFSALPKRDLFKKIKEYVKERQIIVLTGLRRTGKSVLMHQLIELLLKRVKKENILYYDFDLAPDKQIDSILNEYQEIVGVDWKKERVFVFLDEIQKHKNWKNELKILYDFNKNIKFFISGSSSLFIEKRTKESLAGRTFSFTLAPMSFSEYLRIKNVKFEKEKLNLFKEEIIRDLDHYIKIGGFPELIWQEDEIKINKYIKESIIDKVAYIDIPKVFEIEEPELLVRLLSIISSNPGMLTDYEELASDLKRNRKTISNYLFYLEKAFLIKKIYNYSNNLLTSEKKLKKLYPASTAFSFLYQCQDIGKKIETLILQNQDIKFFSRKGNKEVDFVKVNEINKKILPIEVKYAKKIRRKEIKGLINFMKKQKLKNGLVITQDYEAEDKINDKKIQFMPLWKWLLKN